MLKINKTVLEQAYQLGKKVAKGRAKAGQRK
jgi:hypothetical protein